MYGSGRWYRLTRCLNPPHAMSVLWSKKYKLVENLRLIKWFSKKKGKNEENSEENKLTIKRNARSEGYCEQLSELHIHRYTYIWFGMFEILLLNSPGPEYINNPVNVSEFLQYAPMETWIIINRLDSPMGKKSNLSTLYSGLALG